MSGAGVRADLSRFFLPGADPIRPPSAPGPLLAVYTILPIQYTFSKNTEPDCNLPQ